MCEEKYTVYSHDAHLDLFDDERWIESLADGAGVDPSEIGDEEKYAAIGECDASDLWSSVEDISQRFDDQVDAICPEWGGDYLLMAKGSIERWDGVSCGHNYYAGSWDPGAKRTVSAFEKLLGDTGYSGLLKDCEISEIWEGRDGTLHVEGVHHDGRVSVAVRAVGDWMEDFESDCVISDGERERVVATAWEQGVNADMAGCYGYKWPEPSLEQGPRPRDARPETVSAKDVARAASIEAAPSHIQDFGIRRG